MFCSKRTFLIKSILTTLTRHFRPCARKHGKGLTLNFVKNEKVSGELHYRPCIFGSEMQSWGPWLVVGGILVDHSFWQSCSASGLVANILSEYKQMAAMLCDMARFVFLEQDKFSHLPRVEVNAQDLRQWSTVLPQRLPKWVHEDVVAAVDARLLSVCKDKEKSLYSAGLAAVASIAKQCGDGVLPSMPPETQAQLLLKIPKAHELRPVVAAFLEASKNMSISFCALVFRALVAPL